MLKKSLIILSIIFCILFVSNVCFASNTMNDMGNGIKDAANTAVDGAKNLAGDVRNGVGGLENGIEGAFTMDNTAGNNNNMNNGNNGNAVDNGAANTNVNTNATNYTAARTSANGFGGTTSSTMWVWLIVAIAAVVIIGLVWYYGSQQKVD